MVDDDGIAALSYNSPCSVSETSVSAASLMPFEKIREIFEKMVLIVESFLYYYLSCFSAPVSPRPTSRW